MNTAPVATGKNITVSILTNTVMVTGQQIDDGSSDADNDPLFYKINGQDSFAYTPANIGDNTATLTVYDGWGGSNSCQVTVTVVPQQGQLAVGGDVISIYTNFAGTSSQTVYACHQYTTAGSASFYPTKTLKVEYLVIGGGGGGSGDNGGGGGAGGYRCSVVDELTGGSNTADSVTNLASGVAVSVNVGQGGAASSQGSNSWFGAISALGGGYGGPGSGWSASGPGGPGGSGGGGYYNGAAGSGTSRQGCNGGPGFDDYPTGSSSGGGGGGAGQAGWGSNLGGVPYQGGNGGAGLASRIADGVTWVTRAGGGRGSAGSSAGAGASAEGGGGNAAKGATPAAAGKNGIMIVRYVIPPPIRGTVFLFR